MISRYSLPEMEKIWSDENRLQQMLQVELYACEAMKDSGKLDTESYEEIVKRAGVDVRRVKEIEAVTKHDVAAFLDAVTEQVGPENAKKLHWGMTSSDIVDTAMAVQMTQAVDLITGKLYQLRDIVAELAKKHKYTLMVARTHGIQAEPMSFGMKMVVWVTELDRTINRMQQARNVIAVGKISGVTGLYAHIEPFVEEHVCRRLDLKQATASSQILQRDRHAELMLALALLGSTLDKFAVEIRTLERTEIKEISEPLEPGMIGASAMPHKINPVKAEHVSGLARILRANAMAALENVALWDERDLTHSPTELVIIQDSCLLADFMLQQMIDTLTTMSVNHEQMEANLDLTRGLIFSQRILMTLLERGVPRKQAYAMVQRNAMRSYNERTDFAYELLQDAETMTFIAPDELDDLFDYEYFLRNIDYVYKRAGIF